jgi:hypothetical protein
MCGVQMSLLNNKKGAELAIIILVFITLILAIFSLYLFLTGLNKNNVETADNIGVLDNVYFRAFELNTYIQNIVDNSANINLSQSNSKVAFIANIKNNLGYYKSGNDFLIKEMGQIEGQLKEENVAIYGELIKLNLSISISGMNSLNKERPTVIIYNYIKTFEGRGYN